MEAGDYTVEYAKSGRAKCRLTGKSIPNKALRIGEVVEGDYGTYPRWMNFDDFEKDYDACQEFANSTTELHGLSSLKPKDKERIKAIKSGAGMPAPGASTREIPKQPAPVISNNYDAYSGPTTSLSFGMAPTPTPSLFGASTTSNGFGFGATTPQLIGAAPLMPNRSSMFGCFGDPNTVNVQPTDSFTTTGALNMQPTTTFARKKPVTHHDTAPMFSAPRQYLDDDAPMDNNHYTPQRTMIRRPQRIVMPNQEVFTSMTQPKDLNDVNAMMKRLTPVEMQLILTRLIMQNPEQETAIKSQILQLRQERQAKLQ